MAPTKRKSTALTSPSSSPPPPPSSTLNPPSKRNKQTSTPFTSATSLLPTAQLDDESNTYWNLSSTRRITLSTFRNQKMVSIREYYQKDTKWLPGKKGISMTLEQFNTLIDVLPQIERVVRKEGGDGIGRPRYDDEDNGVEEGRGERERRDDEDEDEDGEDGEKDISLVMRNEKKEKERKSNIEATSDEDEGD